MATLGRAREAIQEWKARQGGTLSVPVQVLLRRGVYELPETLEFTPEDSGTEACPITWAAYPGESVTLPQRRRASVERLAAGQA